MTQTLATADGLKLQLRHWPAAAAATARGTVLIVHGLGEHIGRYNPVAAHLNAWDWNAVGYDHRGHGRSEGGLGRLAHGDDLLRDLGGVIDLVRLRYPAPLVLLGHSMGGLVAARFVAEGVGGETPAPWYRAVDALVLSSPALEADMNGFQKLLLSTLGALAPDLAVSNGLKSAWVSRDPKVVAAYDADPLVHDRITPKLARFILDGGALVRARAPQWALPTLLMYGGSDRCVAPRGSRAFAESAPAAWVQAQAFPALAHEIFNEPEQADVFATLQSWLGKIAHPV